MAEAFNSRFKGELIHNPLKRGRGWQSINDVEIAVAEYVDWYNHRRVHGELAQRSPAEVEQTYWAARYDQPPSSPGHGDRQRSLHQTRGATTTTFPLPPPRLRTDRLGGDGLRHLVLAHPDQRAFYAVRVPLCRVTSRASSPPHLTVTQLPPTRGSRHRLPQRTSTS